MLETNKMVCDGLRKVANLSQFAGDNKFAIMAFRKAASAIEELQEDVKIFDYTKIKGIGAGGTIAKIIDQLIKTGTCDRIVEMMPKYEALMELLKIPGVGSAGARKLFNEHGARNIEDVRKLVAEGKVTGKRIIESLKGVGTQGRIPFEEAIVIAVAFIDKIKNSCGTLLTRIEAAGSLRRKKPTIGDLDVIVEAADKIAVATKIKELMDGVDNDGTAKLSGSVGKMHCDVRFAEPDTYGAMILYFTGSKEHNIMMRTKAIKKGLRLNEYGLWRGEEKICGSTEEQIFASLEMEFVPPDKRGM